jgi:hypothetical protein
MLEEPQRFPPEATTPRPRRGIALSPSHPHSDFSIIGGRVGIGVKLIADIGKQRCRLGDFGIHAVVQLDPREGAERTLAPVYFAL